MIGLCLLLLSGAGAGAQETLEALEVPTGARVRVTSGNGGAGRVTGSLVYIDPDSLVVRPRGESPALSLSFSRVEMLEVSRGRDGRAGARQGVTWGVYLGAGIGVIAGALSASGTPTDPAESALLGAVGGAVVGGGLGAAVGAVFPPERWTRFRVVPRS